MGKALVVYESMFGNTREVAREVAEGLGEALEVQLVEVGEAPDAVDDDVALLVLGGPTHAHGLSRATSRGDSVQHLPKYGIDALISQGRGIREWLEALSVREDMPVATFDTRIKGPKLIWGSAAKAADKRLKDKGLLPLVAGESFIVKMKGESWDLLLPGERERARRWARDLAGRLG